MKKTTYLLAIFIAFQTLTFAQYTPIPDANFEQALIDFNIDSEGTLDGQILTSDAESEVNLSIINRNVADFTGIEAFINVLNVNVSYNTGFTDLDLTALTLLQSLDTEGCSGLSNILVTGLTSLTSMNLFGNAITSLDVSTNTALETLNVRNCALTELDLSSNTALVNLNCRNNGGGTSLTLLDVRNGNNANVVAFNSDFNGNLTCIFVDDATAAAGYGWIIDSGSTFVETEGECETLSVDTFDASAFSMYPNPATNVITISTSLSGAMLEIYNITGKRVLSKELAFGKNSFNVSSLQSGVYLARFTTEAKTETKKLIIN